VSLEIPCSCRPPPSRAQWPDTENFTRPELDAALEAARAAWPSLAITDERFLRHLARSLGATDDPGPLLPAQLHSADLFLACACAEGDPRALVAFESRYGPEIDAALARVRVRPEMRDDVAQGVRTVLFVGGGDAPGKIAEYRGRGELRWWVRATVLRAAYKALRRADREIFLDDDALTQLAGVGRAKLWGWNHPDVNHDPWEQSSQNRWFTLIGWGRTDPSDDSKCVSGTQGQKRIGYGFKVDVAGQDSTELHAPINHTHACSGDSGTPPRAMRTIGVATARRTLRR
jgi:hypothetical protein